MAQPEPPIEVANEYVTVRKRRVETEKEGVLGIELRLSTDADGPVEVRVVDQLPEFVSMQDVGLHPGYKPRNWTIHKNERRLAYEDVVSPNEELVTLYGVLTENYDDLEAFLAEPTIERAEPTDDEAESASGEGSVFGDSLLGGSENGEETADESGDAADGSAAPAASAEDGSDGSDGRAFVYEGERRESLLGDRDTIPDASIPDATSIGKPIEAARSSEGDEPAEPTANGADGVLSALLEELEDDAADDEQVEALREALGVETSDSVGVRLSHLQSEVATISAFADEFEQFVDTEGNLGSVVRDLRSEIERLEADLDELSSEVREEIEDVAARSKKLRSRVSDVDDSVDDLTDDLDAIETEQADIRGKHDNDIGRLDGRLEELESAYDETVETVRDDVDALSEDLEAERRWRRTVIEGFGDIVDRSFEAEAFDGSEQDTTVEEADDSA